MPLARFKQFFFRTSSDSSESLLLEDGDLPTVSTHPSESPCMKSVLLATFTFAIIVFITIFYPSAPWPAREPPDYASMTSGRVLETKEPNQRYYRSPQLTLPQPITTLDLDPTPSVGLPLSSATETSSPTVPSTPPVLPTPFPQAWDGVVSSNFSASCLSALQSMTQMPSFLTCRPFSLLQTTSSSFMQAQTNLSAMNTLIWGTCNTTTSADQCTSNMQLFSANLKTQCASDIESLNPLAIQAIQGLDSFSLLRQAACMQASTTNSANVYCYIEALQFQYPSDLAFYQLPFGQNMSSDSYLTCSPCTQAIMNLFAQQGGSLTGLQDTYAPVADLMTTQCGASFVPSQLALVTQTPNSAHGPNLSAELWVGVGMMGVLWSLMGM